VKRRAVIVHLSLLCAASVYQDGTKAAKAECARDG
jgi:hypothetical protein